MAETLSPAFASRSAQDAAGRLGLIMFIASEAMLFSGMFALYGAYRLIYPHDFAAGVRGNELWAGSLNTGLLLTSSWTVALAHVALSRQQRRQAGWLIAATLLLAAAFLVVKGSEYLEHIRHGEVPGSVPLPGLGAAVSEQGRTTFLALYYLMTGTHALHVMAGMLFIAIAWWSSRPRADGPPLVRTGHLMDLAALYWHFVDAMWVFLWPLFYLLRGGS
jgi:cytochrome c oxidase subunit 3